MLLVLLLLIMISVIKISLENDCEIDNFESDYYFIGLSKYSTCKTYCILYVDYEDSSFYKNYLEYKFIEPVDYSQVITDIYITFINNQTLFIIEKRNNQSLNHFDEGIIIIECQDFDEKLGRNMYYLFNESGDKCFTSSASFDNRTQNNINCAFVFMAKAPLLVTVDPPSFPLFIKLAPISIYIRPSLFSKITWSDANKTVNVKKIHVYMSRCFLVDLINTSLIIITIPLNKCCECGCSFDIYITLYFTLSLQIFMKKFTIQFKEDLKCFIHPYFNMPSDPIVIEKGVPFNITVSCNPTEHNVIVHNAAPDITFDINFDFLTLIYTIQFTPIVDVRVLFKFFLIITKFSYVTNSTTVKGFLYLILINTNIYEIKPNALTTLLFRKRKIGCYFNQAVLNMKLLLTMNNIELNTLIIDVTIYTEKVFNLTCILLILNEYTNKFILVHKKSLDYTILPNYTMLFYALFNKQDEIENIVCRPFDLFDDVKLNMNFSYIDIPLNVWSKFIPLTDQTPDNELSLDFSTYPNRTGRYEIVCYAEYLEVTRANKLIKYYIEERLIFISKNALQAGILPYNPYLDYLDKLKCISNSPLFDEFIITIKIQLREFELFGTSVVIPNYLNPGELNVQCTIKQIGKFIFTFEEKKSILDRSIYFYPNLPFYLITNRMQIFIKLNPKNYNIGYNVFYLSTSDLQKNLTKFLHIESDRILISSEIGQINFTIYCKINFFDNWDKQWDSRSKSKYMIIVQEVNISMTKKFTYLLNETLTCRPKSKNLENLSEFYHIEFSARTIPANSPHHLEFEDFDTFSVNFKSNSVPGDYKITCIFKYLAFKGFLYYKRIIISKVIYLTGIISFYILPKSDVILSPERVCCHIDIVVGYRLYMKAFELSSDSRNVSVCRIIYFNREVVVGHVYCTVTYNDVIIFMHKRMVQLVIPKEIYIQPLDIKIGDEITCFPYKEIFNYEIYDNISITITWNLIQYPKLDEEIFGFNITFYENKTYKLHLLEEFTIFGHYLINCKCDLTIRGKSYLFSLNKSFDIKEFEPGINEGITGVQSTEQFLCAVVAISCVLLYYCFVLAIAHSFTLTENRSQYVQVYMKTAGYKAKRKKLKKNVQIPLFYFPQELMRTRHFFKLYRLLELRIFDIKETIQDDSLNSRFIIDEYILKNAQDMLSKGMSLFERELTAPVDSIRNSKDLSSKQQEALIALKELINKQRVSLGTLKEVLLLNDPPPAERKITQIIEESVLSREELLKVVIDKLSKTESKYKSMN